MLRKTKFMLKNVFLLKIKRISPDLKCVTQIISEKKCTLDLRSFAEPKPIEILKDSPNRMTKEVFFV